MLLVDFTYQVSLCSTSDDFAENNHLLDVIPEELREIFIDILCVTFPLQIREAIKNLDKYIKNLNESGKQASEAGHSFAMFINGTNLKFAGDIFIDFKSTSLDNLLT